MAPSATEAVTNIAEHLKEKSNPGAQATSGHREALNHTGILDYVEQFDVTPVIGREFVGVDLAEWPRAPNSDELLRDLAITGELARLFQGGRAQTGTRIVSQRGIVFFRKQDGITNGLRKELVQRLGELTGKPATSKLHIPSRQQFVARARRRRRRNQCHIVRGPQEAQREPFSPIHKCQSQKGR
ncbi:hypothetical protein DL769_011110 [Monosporascus sp. CRB-8-3]|nr:hypothetical protein DL769_011110 [Monosporascus sp. CRB-8-3]